MTLSALSRFIAAQLVLLPIMSGCALDEEAATTSESQYERSSNTPEEAFTETVVSIAENTVIDITTKKITRTEQVAFKEGLIATYGDAQTNSFWTPDNDTFSLQFWDQPNFVGNTTRFRLVASPLSVGLDLSTVARSIEPCFGGSITKAWFEPNECTCLVIQGAFRCGVLPRSTIATSFLEVRSAVNGLAVPIGIFAEPSRATSVVTIRIGVNPTVDIPGGLPPPRPRWL